MCKCSWRKNEPLLPWALLTVWNVNPPVKQGALLTQLMRNSLFKLQAGQLVVIWRKERNLAEKQLGAFSQVSRRQWGPMVVYATRLMDPLWGDKSRVREGSGSDSWRGMRGSAIWQSGEMGGGVGGGGIWHKAPPLLMLANSLMRADLRWRMMEGLRIRSSSSCGNWCLPCSSHLISLLLIIVTNCGSRAGRGWRQKEEMRGQFHRQGLKMVFLL